MNIKPKISESTWALIHEVWKLKSQLGWIRRGYWIGVIVDLLQQIGASRELLACRPLCSLLFDDDQQIKQAAAQAVAQLLTTANGTDYLNLSADVDRADFWYELPTSWQTLKPDDVKRLVGEGVARFAVVGMITFHRNGYVRQAALQYLATAPIELALPFYLLRVNDWVAPIRAEAANFLWDRIATVDLAVLTRFLPLILRLLDCVRADHSELVRTAIKRFTQSDDVLELPRAIEAVDRPTHRRLIRFILDEPGLNTSRIVALAIRSSDPVIRLWGARQLQSVFAGEALDRLINGLRADTSMPVRREALLAVASTHPEEAIRIWKAALLDKHRSIRELARFYLDKLGESGLAELYRIELKKNQGSIIAIAGLGETGTVTDLPLLIPFLQAATPGFRRVAIHAVAAIADDAVIATYVLPAIGDACPSVACVAKRVLIEHLGAVDAEKLCDLAEADTRDVTGRAVLEILDELGKWASLPYLIRLAAADNLDVADHARALVRGWFNPPRVNRVFSNPSPAEKELLQCALTQAKDRLTTELQRELAMWLAPQSIVGT